MSKDRFQLIVDNQKHLMEVIKKKELSTDKYLTIPDNFPVEINDRLSQRYVRELGNRFIEELGESLNESKLDNIQEELIDCLHFLVELSIVVGYDIREYLGPKFLHERDDLYNLYYHFVYHLNYTKDFEENPNLLVTEIVKSYGYMMNQLRSKPWKENYDETNLKQFNDGLYGMWKNFTLLLNSMGLEDDSTWKWYKKKNQVNLDRQENGY